MCISRIPRGRWSWTPHGFSPQKLESKTGFEDSFERLFRIRLATTVAITICIIIFSHFYFLNTLFSEGGQMAFDKHIPTLQVSVQSLVPDVGSIKESVALIAVTLSSVETSINLHLILAVLLLLAVLSSHPRRASRGRCLLLRFAQAQRTPGAERSGRWRPRRWRSWRRALLLPITGPIPRPGWCRPWLLPRPGSTTHRHPRPRCPRPPL
jgi:hypothetical protein